MMRLLLFLVAFPLVLACSTSTQAQGSPAAPPLEEGQAEAIFAGGCFWCMEAPFEALEGVLSVTSGYIGGRSRGPTYEQVSRGGTGHAEAVRVVYDPSVIDYERLLEVFWHNIDPTQANGQFCDHGDQYRSAIFVVDGEQRRLAEASRQRVRAHLRQNVVTQIVPASVFWVAEDYHQDYYRTHPAQYRSYRASCGRDARLRQLWGAAAGG
jgi:peptide-methionine (S)-S-oxide reductase